jgi:hypothetical protein
MDTSQTNPALETILADYRLYHAVLVIVAAIFVIALTVLVVVCVRSLRAARRSPGGATRRQAWTYGLFIGSALLLGLFLLLVMAANVSTVINPESGFAGVDQSGKAITAWLASGSPSVPAGVQAAVDDRLAWQRPKAIAVSILLVLVVVGSIAIWRRWIARSSPSRGANALLLASGVVTAGMAVLLMLMVMGNVQASMAPIAITLAFG